MRNTLPTTGVGMGAFAAPDAQEEARRDARHALWVALGCSLIVMGALISFLWAVGPAWYIRLTGVEAPGRVFTESAARKPRACMPGRKRRPRCSC